MVSLRCPEPSCPVRWRSGESRPCPEHVGPDLSAFLVAPVRREPPPRRWVLPAGAVVVQARTDASHPGPKLAHVQLPGRRLPVCTGTRPGLVLSPPGTVPSCPRCLELLAVRSPVSRSG